MVNFDPEQNMHKNKLNCWLTFYIEVWGGQYNSVFGFKWIFPTVLLGYFIHCKVTVSQLSPAVIVCPSISPQDDCLWRMGRYKFPCFSPFIHPHREFFSIVLGLIITACRESHGKVGNITFFLGKLQTLEVATTKKKYRTESSLSEAFTSLMRLEYVSTI